MAATDTWDPDQYEQFKAERAQPFHDLLSLVEVDGTIADAVDLGCGTGELTKLLHERVGSRSTVGVDSSEAMLTKAAEFTGPGLSFGAGDIARFDGPPRDD